MSFCSCCNLTTWNSKLIQNNKLNKQLYCVVDLAQNKSIIDEINEIEMKKNIILKFSSWKAGSILLHKNKILIVQSNQNKWGFPKGGIEIGESFKDCAIREVKEETSFDIELTEEDRFLKYFNKTIFYFKELEKKPHIEFEEIFQNGKDCSGIGWIRLSCLKKAQQNKITKEMFNASLRKFVKYYF
jgi:ADP-ribose pyrophosphatase YjhB (NUDIX family)